MHFFSKKKIFSKDMKAIIYKMKWLNMFVYFSKGSFWHLQASRINLNYTNQCRKSGKVIKKSLKTWDFLTPTPLTLSFDNNIVIFGQ